MPNHYTNILIVYPDYGREEDSHERIDLANRLALTGWGADPLERVMPAPAEVAARSAAHAAKIGFPVMTEELWNWETTNRGCKWDAYDVLAPLRLPGARGAVQITFCTAWSPPNEEVRERIARELLDRYLAMRVVWVGLQPYNDTFEHHGEWVWEPGPRLVRAQCPDDTTNEVDQARR